MSDLLVLCPDCILVCCSNLCQAGDRSRACHDKQGYNEDEGDHGHGGKKGEGDHSHCHGGRKKSQHTNYLLVFCMAMGSHWYFVWALIGNLSGSSLPGIYDEK